MLGTSAPILIDLTVGLGLSPDFAAFWNSIGTDLDAFAPSREFVDGVAVHCAATVPDRDPINWAVEHCMCGVAPAFLEIHDDNGLVGIHHRPVTFRRHDLSDLS